MKNMFLIFFLTTISFLDSYRWRWRRRLTRVKKGVNNMLKGRLLDGSKGLVRLQLSLSTFGIEEKY